MLIVSSIQDKEPHTILHQYSRSAAFNPSDQRPFLITTNDIFSSNWSQPIYFDQTGIDPDLFFDDDGRVYLSTALPENAPAGGNSSIWQSEVDITTGTSLTQPSMIYRSSLPLEIRWAEGPHLYKINGSYYLSVAEGKCNDQLQSL